MKHDWKIAVLILCLIGVAVLGAACTPPTIVPTPTPTRTPQPTATMTPSPTPTPAFPVSVGCSSAVPEELCARLKVSAEQDSEHFSWSDTRDVADVQLGFSEGAESLAVGEWTYALAAPFFTVRDNVTLAEIKATWSVTPTGVFIGHPLLVSPDTYAVLTWMWGPALSDAVQVLTTTVPLSTAEQMDAWAIVPFHELGAPWKVLRVDDISLLQKGGDLSQYPLRFKLYLGSVERPETLVLLPRALDTFINRDEDALTVVAMTGVTALTRATALLMDRVGVTYPAQDIKPWFEDADFVHISNEVSFRPDCIAEGSGTMSFCSHDSYIALLEEINTNIVELTGNHLEDKGTEWVEHSLDMYRERGWQWFGGGANQAEGAQALLVEQGPNKIAFIGCNTVGPFASEDSGGAARCDFEQVRADISRLSAEGYGVIVTVQYLEDYDYSPTAPQMRDFRSLAAAGAVMVQGSQAHQAQTMEFYDGTFVHYGLGNFFFDQMWSDGTRQEFVDRLTFYEGRLLSVDIRTAILEEFGRPRPMTVGDPFPEADRALFLEMMFELSPQP